MDVFFKVTAGVLVVSILSLVLAKQGKDFSLLLTLATCCMVMVASSAFLQPIISFLSRLTELGGLNSNLIQILLKVVGIGLVSQIACLICADSGNQSLGKGLQMMATTVILWICMPILEELLSVIESILGAI